uniref:Uncharacterized protein n=1 Tax=Aplanochytrium stocchinoi TaxID=215587 RepID=A0A7S3PFN1_9STRA
MQLYSSPCSMKEHGILRLDRAYGNLCLRTSKASAFETFIKFVVYDKNGNCISTSRIFGRECYESWLAARSRAPKAPEESFRRALISHLTASEGRKPFPPDVEKLLLRDIRRKETWKCFENFEHINIGSHGFKKLGYHERKQRANHVATKLGNSSDEESVPSTNSGCTSLAIFLSFVKSADENTDCDAGGLISKDCFDSWLAARICRPRMPEESFRRSLISHLTASDGRKAFPSCVEADLLRHIRKKQIWPCFRGTNSKIGLRGFQKMGYHEKRQDHALNKHEQKVSRNTFSRTKEEEKRNSFSHFSDASSRSCNSPNGSRVDSEWISEYKSNDYDSLSDSATVSSTERTTTRKRNIRELSKTDSKDIAVLKCGYDAHLLQDLVFYASRQQEARPKKQKCISSIYCVKEETKETEQIGNASCTQSPAQVFVQTLADFHNGPRNLLKFLKLLKDQGEELLTPSLYYMLNHNPGNDLYFQREFLFPAQEDRYFLKNRPVGTISMDKDFMIKNMSLAGANILGGAPSLQVENWLKFSGSRVQCALLIMNMFPALERQPDGFPIWFRKCLRCIDGLVRVVMMNVKYYNSTGIFEMAVQDISDLYSVPGMGKHMLLSFD